MYKIDGLYDSQIITFNKIENNNNNHAIQLDTGLLLNWGELEASGTVKEETVQFLKPYKSPPCVFVLPKSSSGNMVQFSNFGYNVTEQGFNYYNANAKYVYFAIGEGLSSL